MTTKTTQPNQQQVQLQPLVTNQAKSNDTTSSLARYLIHDNHELRATILNIMNEDSIFRTTNYYESTSEYRQRVIKRLEVLKHYITIQDYKENPLQFQKILECLTYCDFSTSIKAGVHYTLCGGSIMTLGTSKHHNAVLNSMNKLELFGCFGMTEVTHGSNVMKLQTTCTYDKFTQEFVLHTPNDGASKFWIGGASETAHICVVFAQLIIDSKSYGVHAFLVPLRNPKTNQVYNGVTIKECGIKMGMNGVDNGQIWFDQYRISRDSLLDKYAQVLSDGTYQSPISSSTARFATMISGLVSGRVVIASSAVDATQIGLTIAIRYGYQRVQFGPTTTTRSSSSSSSKQLQQQQQQVETPIIEFLTHQLRLLPALATTIVLKRVLVHLKDVYVQPPSASSSKQSSTKYIHLLASGMKAWCTWHRRNVLHDCRECCGGFGVLAINRIGMLINDHDVDVTFEGDNTVLLQQITKALLADVLKKRKKGGTKKSQSSTNVVKTFQLNFGDNSIDGLKSYQDLFQTRLDIALDVYSEEYQKQLLLQQRNQNHEEAYNSTLDLGLDVAWAYLQKLSFDIFMNDSIQTVPTVDIRLQPILCNIGHLFALTQIKNHEAFYIRHNVLSSAQLEELRECMNGIVREWVDSKFCLQLIDSFDIPEYALAPISRPDYVGYFGKNRSKL